MSCPKAPSALMGAPCAVPNASTAGFRNPKLSLDLTSKRRSRPLHPHRNRLWQPRRSQSSQANSEPEPPTARAPPPESCNSEETRPPAPSESHWRTEDGRKRTAEEGSAEAPEPEAQPEPDARARTRSATAEEAASTKMPIDDFAGETDPLAGQTDS